MIITKWATTSIRRYFSILLVALLASCGGGSENGGIPIQSNTANGGDKLAAVAQYSTAPANSCGAKGWTAGTAYRTGNLVFYPSNSKYYVATNDNPGYDPTVSTWYWSQASCAPIAASTAAPASTQVSSCNATTWSSGTAYSTGTNVRYPANGNYYIATHDNPGYDPTVSTWYWSPTTCQSQQTPQSPAQGTGGSVITEAQFNQMFPARNSFYTYSGLIAAISAYPTVFTNATAKQEAAAFLANVGHETGGLVYIREVNQANWSQYCSASTQYPCAAGQQYYGRGPIQLSWNYNYGEAGQALGLNLLRDPDLIARDSTVAWKTAMWFWMTQRGAGTMTAHDAMAKSNGFAETIRTINGALECNQPAGSVGNLEMQSRISSYQNFARILGVLPGSNLSC